MIFKSTAQYLQCHSFYGSLPGFCAKSGIKQYYEQKGIAT